MSDIVERLRAVANFNDGKLAHEAADELARLRAELERERARVDALSAIERALQHVAISLQEHFDGTGMEISSSYHHFVYLPNMIRKALAGSEQYALDENDRAALDRFMADQPKDRPDRVVEKLREITQACIALRNGIGRCYRMLQSEPDTKGALFKAENILRDLHTAAPVPAAVPVVKESLTTDPVPASDAKDAGRCGSCANFARTYGMSQESCCSHCIWQFPGWRTDLYKPIDAAIEQSEGGEG